MLWLASFLVLAGPPKGDPYDNSPKNFLYVKALRGSVEERSFPAESESIIPGSEEKFDLISLGVWSKASVPVEVVVRAEPYFGRLPPMIGIDGRRIPLDWQRHRTACRFRLTGGEHFVVLYMLEGE